MPSRRSRRDRRSRVAGGYFTAATEPIAAQTFPGYTLAPPAIGGLSTVYAQDQAGGRRAMKKGVAHAIKASRKATLRADKRSARRSKKSVRRSAKVAKTGRRKLRKSSKKSRRSRRSRRRSFKGGDFDYGCSTPTWGPNCR